MFRHSKNSVKTAILSSLLSISFLTTAILAAFLPAADTVYAATAKDETNTCLGTTGIGRPQEGLGGWSYVYFGRYDGEPVKYRVLSPNTADFGGTTMLLDCDSLLICMNFDNDNNNTWQSSDARDWLNEDFYNSDDVFKAAERNAVAQSIKEERSDTDGKARNDLIFIPINGDRVFLLDNAEASNTSYGYPARNEAAVRPEIRKKNLWKDGRIIYSEWWLRSINRDIDHHPHYVGVVGQDGVIFDKDAYKGKNNTTCLSPALNIDLDSVIFASVIKGGMGESKSEYKMTLKDEDLAINTKWVVKEGNEVTVKYSGVTGNPDRIAYLITDKAYDADGCKIIKYSAAEIEGGEIGTSGKLKFTLPDDFDKSWKVYILAENTNEDMYTDFASVPKLVKEKAPGEYSVTVECDGKGTASADPESGKEEETIKLSAEANKGWIFKNWEVVSGDVKLEDPEEEKTQFVLKESDVVVKAVFEKKKEDSKDDDDDDHVEEPAGKPAVVNPDTVEGYFLVNGQPLPGVTLGKTKQGPAAQAVFKASTPAGWNEAFSFNISVNGKFEYTLKNGVLHIVIPKELRKPGRVFAVTGLDKNGKVTVFNDTDTDPNTLTANISFEGYAFELIYKD